MDWVARLQRELEGRLFRAKNIEQMVGIRVLAAQSLNVL
jgi:hypothetical protein